MAAAREEGLKSHNVTGKYNIEYKILYITPMVVRMICTKIRARQKSPFLLKYLHSKKPYNYQAKVRAQRLKTYSSDVPIFRVSHDMFYISRILRIINNNTRY